MVVELDLFDVRGLPATHFEFERNHAGAGLELALELGPQRVVGFSHQVQRDDVGLAEVDVEHVAGDDLHLVLQTLAFGLLASEFDEAFGDLDADGACAEILGCGEHDAAVAAAEVVQEFAVPQAGRFEHFVDDGDRRDDVRRQLARFTGRTRRLDPPRLGRNDKQDGPCGQSGNTPKSFLHDPCRSAALAAPRFSVLDFTTLPTSSVIANQRSRGFEIVYSWPLKKRTAALMASRHGVTVGDRL